MPSWYKSAPAADIFFFFFTETDRSTRRSVGLQQKDLDTYNTYNQELAIDVPTRFRMKNYFDITTVETERSLTGGAALSCALAFCQSRWKVKLETEGQCA